MHLNAVTAQLSTKVQNVDKQMENLDLTTAMIEDNLRDKAAALELDERCALLDGRMNVGNAPPSSVFTVSDRKEMPIDACPLPMTCMPSCSWLCICCRVRPHRAAPSPSLFKFESFPLPHLQASMSQASTARSATLRRIAQMEAELDTARRERIQLETSVTQLKGTLLGSPR